MTPNDSSRKEKGKLLQGDEIDKKKKDTILERKRGGEK